MIATILATVRTFWRRDRESEVNETAVLRRTYRILRLSTAMLPLAILLSLCIERTRSDGWEGSISAYYYTASRPIFTGCMVAIGGFLLTIRGNTHIEDTALNLAGMLAPLVPLIPPKQASTKTGSELSDVGFPVTDEQNSALLSNNLTTVLVIAIVALFVALLLERVSTGSFGDFLGMRSRSNAFGITCAVVLIIGGTVLYQTWDSFEKNAHGIAAIAMFICLWPAVVANGVHSNNKRYKRIYLAIAFAMPIAAAAVGVGKLIDPDWKHLILWLEILELGIFFVYWLVQTWDYWSVASNAARAEARLPKRLQADPVAT